MKTYLTIFFMAMRLNLSALADEEPNYYFVSIYNGSHPAWAQAFSNGGNAQVRALIERQCGAFSTNTSFRFSPDMHGLIVVLHLDDRLRFMRGMSNCLNITKSDIETQVATEATWSVARAREAARRDIADKAIRIYWAGGAGSSPCGIPDKYSAMIAPYPKADAGIGCTSEIPNVAVRYGVEYNKVILQYLLDETKKK